MPGPGRSWSEPVQECGPRGRHRLGGPRWGGWVGPRAPRSPRGPALPRSETRAPRLRLTGGESRGAGRGLQEDAVPRVPDSCPGWDAAPVTTVSCVDGSRLKGDGSGNTAGLLPLSDSILWVSEEHSVFVLAPVGFSRASDPSFHYTWQRLCLFCLLSPCAPARGRHNTTVRMLGKPGRVWKELWSQVCLGSKLGPIYY